MRETRVRSWVGKIPRRRKWQPTPVFLPGESHGQRSLVGYHPWGLKESDMAERLARIHVKEEAMSPWRREVSPKERHPGGMLSSEGPPREASQLPGQDGGTLAGADAGRRTQVQEGQQGVLYPETPPQSASSGGGGRRDPRVVGGSPLPRGSSAIQPFRWSVLP